MFSQQNSFPLNCCTIFIQAYISLVVHITYISIKRFPSCTIFSQDRLLFVKQKALQIITHCWQLVRVVNTKMEIPFIKGKAKAVMQNFFVRFSLPKQSFVYHYKVSINV